MPKVEKFQELCLLLDPSLEDRAGLVMKTTQVCMNHNIYSSALGSKANHRKTSSALLYTSYAGYLTDPFQQELIKRINEREQKKREARIEARALKVGLRTLFIYKFEIHIYTCERTRKLEPPRGVVSKAPTQEHSFKITIQPQNFKTWYMNGLLEIYAARSVNIYVIRLFNNDII